MTISGKAVILGADNFEISELIYPLYRLQEAGMEVTVAAASVGKIEGKGGYGVPATVAFDDLDPADYDIVVIPGGFAPDSVRRSQSALELVRQLHAAGKPVAFICHGGWVPISAGILAGKKATGTTAIKDDITNAGATFVDEPVVVDGNLISAQIPRDLAPWMAAVVADLTERASVPA